MRSARSCSLRTTHWMWSRFQIRLLSSTGDGLSIPTTRKVFLDRWRRLRLVLPPDVLVPRLPGVVEVGGSGRLPVLTTNRFEPAMVSACNDLGATVQAVDTMTLEEIFVANVHSRRERLTA